MEFAFSCLKTNSHDPLAISGLQNNFNDLKDMLEKAFKMPDGSIRQTKESLGDLFNLTESSLTCCSLLAKLFEIDFTYILPEKLKKFVLTQETHSSMIKRILYNLMKNAMLYSAESKSPKVSLEIETDQKNDQWRAKFSVTDTGIGMSPQFIQGSLFKEGSREKTTKQSGSGIGLNSCKTLVESMGGEISGCSEGLGKGSTFWFTVPVTFTESVSVSTSPIVKLRADKQHMQVLIVDDDPIGRKMLQRQCKGLGLEHVESVATAEEALNFTGKIPCSLIFMDTNLGGKKDKKDEIDGIELTKKILARTPPQTNAPRTISISGTPQTPAETGMDGVLSKPFDVKRLEMLLEKHFEFSTKNHLPSS
ncbi:hybrid sensor histidine kinase/response regulator [Candidatus Finniella inopinata]|nr:ATP-binding protein [Candidatus Finniella inopinata]